MRRWNDDSGDWQGLDSNTQQPRYRAIAESIQERCPLNSSILDVGCGQGLLARYLPESFTYAGIEPSLKAAATSTRICWTMTAEQFLHNASVRQWDCIVFSEMLYYCRNPRAVIIGFSKLLRPDGVIAISIYQKHDTWKGRLGLSMTNARCTRLVKRLFSHRWCLARNCIVGNRWWLLVGRP